MPNQTIDQAWFSSYFERYRDSLFGESVDELLVQLRDRILRTRDIDGKVLIAGNGGSAAIADHCAGDFTKNAGVRTLSFAGSPWISCLANDYGYEEWVSKSLEMHADPDDLVILLSSGGRSENILRAAHRARALGLLIVTFSGFAYDNPLRSLGDLNFWVGSKAYNVVEMTHQIWLLAVCDAIIGSAEYPAS